MLGGGGAAQEKKVHCRGRLLTCLPRRSRRSGKVSCNLRERERGVDTLSQFATDAGGSARSAFLGVIIRGVIESQTQNLNHNHRFVFHFLAACRS